MNLTPPTSKTINQVTIRKRMHAFTIVSLACFVIFTIFWPMTVRGYLSRGEIKIDVSNTRGSESKVKQLLEAVVSQQFSQDALQAALQVVDQTHASDLTRKLAQDNDLRSKFRVFLNKEESGRFALNVQFIGTGSPAENKLAEVVTAQVAREFLASPLSSLGVGPLANDSSLTASTEDAARRWDDLQASLDTTLAAIENEVNGFPTQPQSGSPFLNASHRSGTNGARDSAATTGNIQQLRQTVSDMTAMVKESQYSQGDSNAAVFSVRQVRSKLNKPIGGVPKTSQLLLLLLAATIVGAAVSISVNPFGKPGFETVDDVKKGLEIPIVAKLKSPLPPTKSSTQTESKESGLSNRLVVYAEFMIFAITMIVLGFCFINSDIRAAFADNPFHGFARIFSQFYF